MQGPAIDLVLLALLILFVGIQQYARPQLRNRLWFAGWVFFFLSYVVWEFRLPNPVLDALRDALRFDLLLLAQLTFVTSFVASAKRLPQVVLVGLIVGVPAVLAFNAHQISVFPLTMLVSAVVLWQVYGLPLWHICFWTRISTCRTGCWRSCCCAAVCCMERTINAAAWRASRARWAFWRGRCFICWTAV